MPRPIRPLVGALLRTRKPRFHWALPADALARSRFQLCTTRRCARPLVDEDVGTATQWQPPGALDGGVYFWRIVGVRADGTEVTSATRAVVVPSTELPPACRQRVVDYNGDGVADTTAYHAGPPQILRVTYGSGAIADTTIEVVQDFHYYYDGCQMPQGGGSYTSRADLVPAGDINGDGFDDAFVVQAMRLQICIRPWQGLRDVIGLALGGPQGLGPPVAELLDRSLYRGSGERQRGHATIEGGEDFNDDGYGDFFVYADTDRLNSCGGSPAATMYFGGPAPCASRGFGFHTAEYGLNRACDVDGDGIDDIATHDTDNAVVRVEGTGGVRTLTAPPRCLGNTLHFASRCVHEPFSAAGAANLAYVGDTNGDGFGDVSARVMVTEGPMRSFAERDVTFFGGPGGLDETRCRLR